MRQLLSSTALAAALVLGAAACSNGNSDPGGDPTPAATPTTAAPAPAVVRADLPRARTTDTTDAELATLVRGDTTFALDLFRVAAAGDENTILSPYSVAAALTMTYAGARGATAEEIRTALQIELPDERLHAARNELDLRITTPPPPVRGDARDPFAIKVANSLWGQQGYPFLEEFLAVLAENYDAGMNLVDFATAAEDARQEINSWVEEQTEGRIVDLIPEGAVHGLTRLVLVNAIWFKANWFLEFDPDRTSDDLFTTLAARDLTVPTMHQNSQLRYFEGEGFSAVRIPYKGDAWMTIVLPDAARFAEIRAGLGPEFLQSIGAGASIHMVDLSLPRFEFRSQLALKPALEQLGIVAAFKDPALPDGADLTGMTDIRELFVSDVIHQAFISVDEKGTEAAAATAVIVGVVSAPPPAQFTVDRPFLFFIEQGTTGEILFLGQVVDPS